MSCSFLARTQHQQIRHQGSRQAFSGWFCTTWLIAAQVGCGEFKCTIWIDNLASHLRVQQQCVERAFHTCLLYYAPFRSKFLARTLAEMLWDQVKERKVNLHPVWEVQTQIVEWQCLTTTLTMVGQPLNDSKDQQPEQVKVYMEPEDNQVTWQ